MSTFIAYMLDSGIVFAADRNVTVPDAHGQYQIDGQKVFRWPNHDALVGYVGLAELDGIPMDVWLQKFIQDHQNVSDPSAVAHSLRDELQEAIDRGSLEASIVQFAAFADVNGIFVPQYWHIANVHGMDTTTGRYDEPKSHYGCSEEALGNQYKEIPPAELRAVLKKYADSYDPRWFHHSFELGVFNMLEAGAKAAFRELHKMNLLAVPQNLEDWEQHARFWILQYGAYFGAFYPHDEQYVGGGADALSIPWKTK